MNSSTDLTPLAVDHVLAVVAVSDFDVAHRWYERLLGAPATNVPMPGSLAEWRITGTGWLQVFHDPERAGTSMTNLAVADLDDQVAQVRARGIRPDDTVTANKNVRLCTVVDPDGNRITLIGNFREHY